MTIPFWEVVDLLREADRRYAREAYGFVVAALGETVEQLPEERRADPAHRHLSGQELLAGVGRLAAREFGCMAPMVFREWGVREGLDVGHIVFQLVGCGQLSARAEDTLEDFRDDGRWLERLAREAEAGVTSTRTAPQTPTRPA